MNFIRRFLAKLFPPGITAFLAHSKDWPATRTGATVGCTIKCPHCATWTYEYTFADWKQYKFTLNEPNSENKAILTCGKCQQDSEWFVGGPIPMLYSDVRKIE